MLVAEMQIRAATLGSAGGSAQIATDVLADEPPALLECTLNYVMAKNVMMKNQDEMVYC
jgi:hypothetical protein